MNESSIINEAKMYVDDRGVRLFIKTVDEKYLDMSLVDLLDHLIDRGDKIYALYSTILRPVLNTPHVDQIAGSLKYILPLIIGSISNVSSGKE